ncbi:MAG: hypothetical protein R2799_15570 [Crocinitomicaceae bacterium]
MIHPKNNINENKIEGTERYTLKVDEMGVYMGYQDYSSATMSGSSGGGRYISCQEFLDGDGQEWVLENFDKELLDKAILECKGRI